LSGHGFVKEMILKLFWRKIGM